MLFFCMLLKDCLDKLLPRRPTPWFNDNISAGIRAKNNAKQTFERSGSDSDRNIYHRLKNELQYKLLYTRLKLPV